MQTLDHDIFLKKKAIFQFLYIMILKISNYLVWIVETSFHLDFSWSVAI
jgi:hypothetical protein